MTGSTDTDRGPPSRAPVWDIPTRLVHWAFVLLIPVLWWTAENHEMEWHRRAGIALLGLLVFRILLGFAGSSTARFSSFLRGPGAVLAYVRGRPGVVHGHNPLGGWSVALMLLLLAAQTGLGLFATDVDGLESGPLATHISFDAARTVADLHGLVFNLLWVVIAIHIAAVLFYLIGRKTNLIGAMVHGRGRTERPMVAAPLWRTALAAALAIGFISWIWKGAPPF
jgi:cytochrome b